MVKGLPSNTEDEALILSQETKIPHVAEQLSLHATTRPSAIKSKITTSIKYFK